MRNQLSIPVTALALLALAACGTESGSGSGAGGDGDGSVTTDLPLTGVHWSVDSVTVDGKKSAAPDGAHVEITSKGRAQGNYGCNHFGADVKVDGDTITVGPGEMTEMGCAKDIQGFEDALRAAFSGKLKAKIVDEKLTLTTEKGDSIALTSEAPAPLVGTKWTVNSLLSGETASSLPPGTEKNAHLTFGKDGSVRGSLGCNTFTSTAKISGSTITFDRLATTRKVCTGTAMTLESHLLKVLDGKVTYKLHHRGLSLTAADGKGLAATAAPAK
ncbi:META domain-containing protein [Streptomyces sp. V1I1]|jgi:heat shock protein HslJ|uniref:META domain-containing protein n=1 Tax=Streptomyces sp. V1I1 TaxID=3042272 RepID=UPI00277EB7AF|nr:META domain-containing protein [Streptomyces sp. V1I1]MDQ0942351.1 heat shock protein HslJ [Streptomyces sp. V1I1]